MFKLKIAIIFLTIDQFKHVLVAHSYSSFVYYKLFYEKLEN